MTSPSSPPAFRLETSDGDQEDAAEVVKGKHGPPPMESPFQGEDRNFSPQIKVNLNYRKGAGARYSIRWEWGERGSLQLPQST
jgi:transient receptor potential cation channel subfamily V protein 2